MDFFVINNQEGEALLPFPLNGLLEETVIATYLT